MYTLTTMLFRVEECATAFLELVTNCGNGAALAVTKGNPPIDVPDISFPVMVVLGVMAFIVSKVGIGRGLL